MISMKNSWTGTPGILTSDLDGDWDDIKKLMEERCRSHWRPTEYTPELLKRAWEFFVEEFGGDAELEEFLVREIVEFYLDN